MDDELGGSFNNAQVREESMGSSVNDQSVLAASDPRSFSSPGSGSLKQCVESVLDYVSGDDSVLGAHGSMTSETHPKVPEDKVGADQEYLGLPNLTEAELFDEVRVLDEGSGPISVVSHLIYVQSGTERREPIEKSDFETFFQFLIEKSEELPLDELRELNVEWYGFGLKRGLVGCLDQHTADFVKKIASQFTIGDRKFRGYSPTEFGDLNF